MIASHTLTGYAGAAHRTAVVELLQRSLLPEDATEAAVIVDLLTRTGDGLVALVGGNVVGVALASAGRKDPTVGHLELLVVDPAHRR
jgi:mycothiol synthase